MTTYRVWQILHPSSSSCSTYAKFANAIILMNVAIVMFDTIETELGSIGLYPPELGSCWYAEMSWALFLTLQNGTLLTDTHTHTAISIAENCDRDGYHLLWDAMKDNLPALNATKHLYLPRWHKCGPCVFFFANTFLIHFRIQRKRHTHYFPWERSLMYLWGITKPSFHEVIVILYTIVDSVRLINAPTLWEDLEIPNPETCIVNVDTSTKRYVPRDPLQGLVQARTQVPTYLQPVRRSQ